jgi:hypothetical protein
VSCRCTGKLQRGCTTSIYLCTSATFTDRKTQGKNYCKFYSVSHLLQLLARLSLQLKLNSLEVGHVKLTLYRLPFRGFGIWVKVFVLQGYDGEGCERSLA